MRGTLGALLLACLAAVASASFEYDGTFCRGAVDFNLTDGVSTESVDNLVRLQLGAIPAWAPSDCRAALQTVQCLYAYATHAEELPKTYCRSACELQLASCSAFFRRFRTYPEADSIVESYHDVCQSLPDTSCRDGGVLDAAAVDAPDCPKPLGVAPEGKDGVRYVDGSACAERCPTTYQTTDDWATSKFVLTICTSCGVFLALITMLSHVKRQLLVLNFTVGSLLSSAIILVTLVYNGSQDELFCDGEFVYLEKSTLCTVQGALNLALIWWISFWALAIATHLYVSVIKAWKKPRRARLVQQYVKGSIVLLCGSFAVGYAFDTVGYDIGFQMPVCTVVQFDSPFWFWGLYVGPNFIAVLGCAMLMLLSLRNILGVMSTSQTTHRSSIVRRQNRAWKRMLWYNQRTIAFTIVYCLVSLFGYGCIVYVVLTGTTTESSLETYTDCLLEEAYKDPGSSESALINACGQYKPKWWIPFLIVVWIGCFGAIPFIIYGTAGKATEVVKHVAEDVERRFSFQERPSIDHTSYRPLMHGNKHNRTDSVTGLTVENPRDTLETRPSEVEDMIANALSGGHDQTAALELELATLSPRGSPLATSRSVRNSGQRKPPRDAADDDQYQRAQMQVDTGYKRSKTPRVRHIDDIEVDMEGQRYPAPLTSRTRPTAAAVDDEDEYEEISSVSDASAIIGEDGLTPMPNTPSVHDALRMRGSEEFLPSQLQNPIVSPAYHKRGSREEVAPTPNVHIRVPSPTHKRMGSNSSTGSMARIANAFRRNSPSAFRDIETPRTFVDPQSQIYGQRAEAIRASQRYQPPPLVVPRDHGDDSDSEEEDDYDETLVLNFGGLMTKTLGALTRRAAEVRTPHARQRSPEGRMRVRTEGDKELAAAVGRPGSAGAVPAPPIGSPDRQQYIGTPRHMGSPGLVRERSFSESAPGTGAAFYAELAAVRSPGGKDSPHHRRPSSSERVGAYLSDQKFDKPMPATKRTPGPRSVHSNITVTSRSSAKPESPLTTKAKPPKKRFIPRPEKRRSDSSDPDHSRAPSETSSGMFAWAGILSTRRSSTGSVGSEYSGYASPHPYNTADGETPTSSAMRTSAEAEFGEPRMSDLPEPLPMGIAGTQHLHHVVSDTGSTPSKRASNASDFPLTPVVNMPIIDGLDRRSSVDLSTHVPEEMADQSSADAGLSSASASASDSEAAALRIPAAPVPAAAAHSSSPAPASSTSDKRSSRRVEKANTGSSAAGGGGAAAAAAEVFSFEAAETPARQLPRSQSMLASGAKQKTVVKHVRSATQIVDEASGALPRTRSLHSFFPSPPSSPTCSGRSSGELDAIPEIRLHESKAALNSDVDSPRRSSLSENPDPTPRVNAVARSNAVVRRNSDFGSGSGEKGRRESVVTVTSVDTSRVSDREPFGYPKEPHRRESDLSSVDSPVPFANQTYRVAHMLESTDDDSDREVVAREFATRAMRQGRERSRPSALQVDAPSRRERPVSMPPVRMDSRGEFYVFEPATARNTITGKLTASPRTAQAVARSSSNKSNSARFSSSRSRTEMHSSHGSRGESWRSQRSNSNHSRSPVRAASRSPRGDNSSDDESSVEDIHDVQDLTASP